ncbi:hypothetical protein A3A46_01360 [Candidatus Roizmanbacteria bacterium RIFCSPLOWO2_01_FULL_37_13]|uniref:Glycosyltransferase RgtA/B/C/D-like domain-containing protein n=1 Tax=Candidatus Roizmanbacteria bacterium RIFCSPHIGHO2_02_FULL_38_11 TaxID=1802039 RepID=A0A1F7H161_9BACT|nr:MAG: hypothetical protein A3C25_01660 [Candidatus Roizmanbacteria bacterium RIFCSPHIGHO2_02_FULL_38_11]OGK32884.1 MAG: hypothetical protein A3F58_01200 [Candidatus Roizmanbacteria bacterium RIFCSPHIGHO2_12_FULL_37_9b]OGK42517.1 MAG: hypothetical protein A3A46_01360 [Candidatus Roizmanbacteria bacterium RIFCSPLOWO2_01_FULL_37_13]
MPKIKWILFFLLFVILVYTRFINLSWGLPHPMHPDERNMANAIQNLNCKIQSVNPAQRGEKFKIQNCFNPNFFAYGQFPLYLGYVIVFIMEFFDGDLGIPISFEEAAFSLRIISAVASILNVFLLLKVIRLLSNQVIKEKTSKSFSITQLLITLLLLIFSPFFIQFAHFGTTESLIMLFYSSLVYLSIKISINELYSKKNLFLMSLISGLAVATKISSVLMLILPLALIIDLRKTNILARIISICYFLALTLVVSIIFSPHNFISFAQFLGSMKYESDVALGSYRAFYSRQFEGINPIFFQLVKIFPYSLGWPAFIFFIFGFIFLPFKLEFNVLRLAILAGFIPNAFLYAKWTRFMTPILPLMLTMSVLFVFRVIPMKMAIYKIRQLIWISAFAGMTMLMVIPGLAYLSIYQNPDVRFTASEWIYKNIPGNSYILFETANVVDIPIESPASPAGRQKSKVKSQNYQMISFNFYDLDENPSLQTELRQHLAKADYMFIPSRRIFANHYCRNIKYQRSNIKTTYQNSNISVILNLFQNLNQKESCQYLRKKYPLLNDYYDKLFSGELGFVKVAEFNAFPKIQLLGKTILEFPDEEAEETWTVFDHPVIRIYKKI